MREYRYTTPHGIQVTRSASKTNFRKGLQHLLRDLDQHRGIYLSSGYEYPGRYSRWDFASTCPPLEIISYDRRVEFRPLNARGVQIARMFHGLLADHPHWDDFGFEGEMLAGRLKPLPALFPEEERSKQPSAFSILRALIEEFRGEEDSRLGLVGAFGYDLLFQFEPIEKKLPRAGHKDLHLFLCDDIWFMDRKKEQVERYQYEFEREGASTRGLARDGEAIAPPAPRGERSDHQRPHAGRVHGERGDGARRHAPRRLLRSGAAPDLPHAVLRQGQRPVPAGADGQPEPVRVPAAIRRRATGGRVAGDVRARGGRAHRDVPHLGHGAAHGRSAARCRQHSRTAGSAPRKRAN